MSGGGAVPGFFFSPFRLAVTWVPLIRTSHVGGNSIGHGTEFRRKVFKPLKNMDDVQNNRSCHGLRKK